MRLRAKLSLRSILIVGVLIFTCALTTAAQERFHYLPNKIGWHEAVYDDGPKHPKLVPWTTWEDALEREMKWYLNCPIDSHGYPTFMFTTFMDEKYEPYKADIIPATQDGMGIISYLKYWRHKGKSDAKILEWAKKMGDYIVKETLTPDKGVYPRFTRSTGIHTSFPLKSSSQGDLKYGVHVIEPDKGGIAGYALVELYKVTQDRRYLDQAVHNADVLASNMRRADATHSPWPFRVDSMTGQHWGERSGNMVYILRLFDGLIEMKMEQYRPSREALWQWIRDFQFNAPEDREHSLWIQFFEDMTVEDNRNAWAPLNMARYLIEKKEALDPDWKQHAEACIQFAIRNFGHTRPGGVMLVGEQDSDRRAWGGVNSTLGGVAAMFYAAGGGEQYREMAFRNLTWMTYFIREDGIVCDQTGVWDWLREGGWQEDCHTDVIHNFMDALTAVPEWATAKTPDGKVQQEKKSYLRAPRHGGVYVVAHRGAHNGIPENSLSAYQKAIDLGADFVEIDVRTTKDGKFVSVHNAAIDAYVPGASGKIRDLTLAELRAFDIGLRVGPQWKGTRIPTFEEILDLCKGKIGIYLDLKDAPVPDLVKLVKRHGMERDIIWYASYFELKQLKRLCYKCVPMPDPGSGRNLSLLLERLQPRIVASYCDKISPSFIKICHDAGAMVIADETTPGCWEQALSWGTDGIQTNHPAKLIELLKARAAGSR